ncbi:mitochondrial RNA pseudouridine synthase Rpusd4-like [Actinia tenebrosa]|uniref:Pseudouridylate synthase RPUSD4, mitochondrial n=1 Tax=Actinia tenebrosa TaxID=6105 RepID=A0A6P8H513_ACTTE|nr:mitochondrial RNA pseudouridine synthase Rpusd4-like [Actinia tenebrosa]
MAAGARTAKRVLNTIIDAQYLADNILFINRDLVALNKPYGIAVHDGPGIPKSISNFLDEFATIKDLGRKPELAHRLDKDCTGVLLLTRNSQTAKRVAEMFHRKKVIKKYWAITIGVPKYEEGKISIPVGYGKVGPWSRIVLRRDLVGKSLHEINQAGFNDAITKFKVLDTNQKTCSLLEIDPVTGHKQQIRVHMADGLRCPILGDHKFSSEQPQPQVLPLRLLQLLQIRGVRSTNDKEKGGIIRPWQRGMIPLHLHARELTLPGLNSGKDLVITAPAPQFFEDNLNKLNLHPRRSSMSQTREEAEYYRLRRLGKSTKTFIGF